MNSTNDGENKYIYVQDDDEMLKIVNDEAVTQQALIAFSATLSILGSATILTQILRNSSNRKTLQQQIVLCMSILDVVAVASIISSDFMYPKDLPRYYLIGGEVFLVSSKFAMGNDVTHYINTFLMQLGLCAILYNAFLATYYLLSIKYHWSDERIKAIAPYIHMTVLVIGFGNAILGYTSDRYEFPVVNRKWYFLNGDIYKGSWLFFSVLWISIIAVTVQTIQMYRYVKQTERSMNQYRRSQRNQSSTMRSELETMIFFQSLLYVGSFYLTWVIPTIGSFIYHYLLGGTNWLLKLNWFLFPLQGFFNTIAYFRPRFLKLKAENSEAKWYVIIGMLLESSLICHFDNFFTTDDKDIFQ
mmetsp:Transcript_973/g.1918  ORF Transcript_973/g.1918 Transcript_973/m.1918 type:complete len:358 (-) Transcript_973:128-1201(-)